MGLAVRVRRGLARGYIGEGGVASAATAMATGVGRPDGATAMEREGEVGMGRAIGGLALCS